MALAEPASRAAGGMFRSLRHRNYRLFFMGQSISLIGNWLQWAAMNWLIYTLTHSPAWLGIVGFCRISILFVAPFAGILADRMDRRKLVVITQVLATIQPAVLAALTLTGWINKWHIVILSIYAGVVAAFDIPIRQAFTVEMIGDKEDLANAIALNSSMVNGARLVGPAVAGLLIKFVGEGWCFLLNALSFLPVIWALLEMEIPPRKPGRQKHVLRELRDGVRYAFGFAPIRSVLLLLCLVSIAGMPYQQFMSAFAQDVPARRGRHLRPADQLRRRGRPYRCHLPRLPAPLRRPRIYHSPRHPHLRRRPDLLLPLASLVDRHAHARHRRLRHDRPDGLQQHRPPDDLRR